MAYDLDEASIELLGGSSLPEQSPAPEEFKVLPGAGRELALAGDPYEGASRVSHELGSYSPAIRSPDQDIRPAKRMADARSRDLSRNDANIQSGVRLRQDSIVGAYLMLNARPNSRRLFGKEDTTWEDEFSEEVEEMFAASAETEDCWLDAGRRHTLTDLVRQAVEQHTIYGECLGSVEWVRESDRPFNTAIQMIDTDRLSTPMNRVEDKNLVMGVQLDSWGKAIGYHIRMAHPSEYLYGQDVNTWKFVPARLRWGRRQMIHLYDQHRPGQTRGIGTMVAAIPEIKLLEDFRKIVLQNAILNATYAATVESDLDASSIFARLGGTDFKPEDVQEALESYMQGHYAALNTVIGKSNQLKLGGLKIPHLPPGSKLNLQGAGQGGPLGSDFEASINRVLASAFGVSYEQWSRDYTKTNYSSGKMAGVETFKAMLSVKRAVADTFASMAYRLWFEEHLNKGAFTTVRRAMPSFYEGLNKEWYCNCDWIGASRGQVDELKETQAAVLRMQNGLSDLSSENARLGFDWRKRMRQMKREKEWKEFYGVLEDETDTTSQENAARGTKREAKKATAHTPSPGTKENLFFDDEHTEEAEVVNG